MTPPPHPPGLFLAASCSRRFTFFEGRLTFAAARLQCQERHTDLAVVRDAEDNAKLLEATGGSPTVWIGLRADTQSWRWSYKQTDSEQSPTVAFTNWRSGSPTASLHKSCVLMNTDGTWTDESCLTLHKFICERGKLNNSNNESSKLVLSV